ncbi:MAG: hypothetical protein IJH12_07315 [Clostridia bacterium]|nr:hypothetical protein [Clostridia bacterium]
MDKKKQYLYNVQKFLDLIENIDGEDLKNEIRMSFFSSLNAACQIANFNIDKLFIDGKN